MLPVPAKLWPYSGIEMRLLLHAIKVLFLVRSVTFLFFFVCEISREPVNEFAPDSQGRRVWSLAWTSLNVKLKGQGHQG